MTVVTPAQMREIEKYSDETGVSYALLMKNAGTELGKNIAEIMKGKSCRKAVFLCGKGNNGGDCFVAAGYLKNINIESSVVLVCGNPVTDIASEEFRNMKGIRVFESVKSAAEVISEADIIIDGVFGTGFHGELDENIKEIFKLNSRAVHVAADIPSGGNALTGTISEGCFKADFTVTFGFQKFGMTQYPLKSFCGKIITADIGLPKSCYSISERDLCIQVTEQSVMSATLRPRTINSHKGTYGTLLCVTGSASMPGAALLSARAALRCGSGLVKVCSVPENIAPLASSLPEAVYIRMKSDEAGFYTAENTDIIIQAAEKSTAVLVGCGLGVTEETKELVSVLIRSAKCPVILDADGINCIVGNTEIINEAKSEIILTPHPAEMARLLRCSTAEIQSDRYSACRKFNSLFPKAIVILKGAGSIISSENMMNINTTGNPGMSCGGSGDVLAGMVASFVAQKINAYEAAVLSAYIHGLAGDRARQKYSMHYMLPSDIINEFSEIFKENESLI